MAAQLCRCISLSICDVAVHAVPATPLCSQERVGHWWPEVLSHVLHVFLMMWLTGWSQGALHLIWNHGKFEYSHVSDPTLVGYMKSDSTPPVNFNRP